MPDDRRQSAARCTPRQERPTEMRWVISALLVLGLVPRAFAADLDLDALRGSEPVGPALFNNWTGFYFGGDGGFSDSSADFSRATQPSIAYVLRDSTLENTSHPSELPVLGTADQTAASYGGFFGYNTQWQDLVLGAEADFVHTTASLFAPSSPLVRSGISDGEGNSYTMVISGTGAMTDLNYVEVRGRAGLVLGNFLPYGFVGAVVGMANINVTSAVQGFCEQGSTVNCSNFAFSAVDGRNSALLYGATVGAGLDWAFTPHFFLRGEYEYTRFAPFDNIVLAISSARAGVGYRF
jgi:opacity protein-like surface antigen